jgi:hypothetical protein
MTEVPTMPIVKVAFEITVPPAERVLINPTKSPDITRISINVMLIM